MNREHDVCLLLEGTYPFISGGVSTWLHRLISGLPELSFTAVCILPSSKEKWPLRYDIPDNFSDYKTIYLHDIPDVGFQLFPRKKLPGNDLIKQFHFNMHQDDYSDLGAVSDIFRGKTGRAPSLYELVHGKAAWSIFQDLYTATAPKDSFLDYFWTYRFTHLPMFKVLMQEVPKARVYHTISTGYAGLLGALASRRTRRPLLLTEHGIYVKERKIEISQAEWIYVAGRERMRVQKKLSAFQKMWIRIFESLGRITYQASSRIYTLYGGNRDLEIQEGAPPEKCEIIPNGIDVERFQNLKPPEYPTPAQRDFVIGFVGRVVPIKDVKTFIRAIKIASMELTASFKVWIMGPNEEDDRYFRECNDLVRILGLKDTIEFTGKVNVMEYYPRIDLLVLTSISEAQPLVILEANCAGIPCVASDVGSCRELLEGRTRKDRAVGPSGIVTAVADPGDTAKAIVAILQDYYKRQAMSLAGRIRVGTFYRESDLNQKYLSIYRQYMEAPDTMETPDEMQIADEIRTADLAE